MVDERIVLVLAQVPRDQRHALMAEAAAAAYDLHYVDSLGAAVLSLATRPPAAVLVDLDLPEAEELCRKVRTKRRTVDIAIFGLVRDVSAETFARALRWGVDDVSSTAAEGALASRLVALPANPASPPTARGDAVVATRDDSEFIVGRLLTNAGFEVEYARDPISLQQLASLERMRLVVTSEAMGSLGDVIKASRKRGSMATWIALAPPERIAGLERAFANIPRAGVISLADPFEHILFVSNELAASASDARRERRVLHGALVRFRSTPDSPAEHGFTYNVSPGGLYVRTLAPPVDDHVHVEVQVPNTGQLARLQGTIAWRRGFARLGSATAPPGFGMKITGGSEEDRASWARGCTQLLVARHAPDKPLRSTGNDPQPAAPTPEEQPRLSEIEELDAMDLASIQPDSLRMIEEGAVRPLGPVPRAPAVPAPLHEVLQPGPNPAKTKPTAPSAEPQPAPAPPPEPAPPAPDPPAAGTAGSGRQPDPDPLAPSPMPSRPEEPASAAEPRGIASPPAPGLEEPQLAAAKPKSPPKHDKAAKRGAKPTPAPSTAKPVSGPKKTGCSVALGLAAGCLLALLSVVTIVLLRSPPWAPPASGTDEASGHVVTSTPRPSSSAADEASPPAAPPPTEAAIDDEPTEEDAGADADEADADAEPDAADGGDSVEEEQATDQAVNQQPTPTVAEVPKGELMHYEAYFVVESSADVRVYSNGIDVGPTNTKNKVRCGLRNVRLGDEPGKWRTPGYTVQIECTKHNRVRLDPTQ